MVRQCVVIPMMVLSLGALGAGARAQDFVEGNARTIPPGDLRFNAAPVALFSKAGGPDRWGGEARLGYGVTDNFDVEGRAAIFNGFSLVGLGTDFWVIRGPVDLAIGLGAHKALVQSGPNSTAFDVSWLMDARLSRTVRFEGGMAASFESEDHVSNSRFERYYIVPGVDWRISRQVDFVSRLGLGLNSQSPNYLSAGFSFYTPVSGGGGGGRDR